MKGNTFWAVTFGLLSGVALTASVLFNKHSYLNLSADAWAQNTVFLGVAAVCGIGSLIPVRQQLESLTARGVGHLLIGGFVMTTAITFVVLGLAYTTATNSSVITTTSILLTASISAFWFREKFTSQMVLSMVVFLAGAYLVVVGATALEFRSGDFIVAGSVLPFAIGNNYAAWLIKSYSVSVVAAFRFIAALSFIPLGLVVHGTRVWEESAGLIAVIAGASFWLAIVLYYRGLKEAGPTLVVISQSTSSIILIAGLSSLLFDEPLTLEDTAGIAVVIFALSSFVFYRRVAARQK